ncbi:hypothetical protein AA0242T_2269 [Acetobacter aceti NRIC 0242]|uniref:Phage protein n=1 Tax=Acetobacter aceti NBRC 14818 TaxID=887700 RepID=A0AB33IG42_ACEAC|nr:hypothetical protein [Acetobacter aceti]BCK75995.1 hypothetical protein EMQ_1601 [Acetobacter aceti NBRC 14818]GAN58407.1 hypothetical protein Abac_049_002 [Acetobacter aceti NBRC 14818]GBO81567.1 hypothetical protein AA0242T_2269 [Acetobacter aceti NRIC 0242]
MTTISLKVDEAVGDIKIAESVAQTVLSFTAVPTPVTTVVSKAVALINGGLDAFQQYAGSTATLTFDSTSVPAALTSVVADIRTAASDISGAATGIEATLAAKVSTVSADVAAVASVIESMFSAVTSARFGLSEVEWRKQRIAAIRLRHGV